MELLSTIIFIVHKKKKKNARVFLFHFVRFVRFLLMADPRKPYHQEA